MAYASFSKDVDSKIQPLVPALKSNWLIAHVMTCFLGYSAFAVILRAERALPGEEKKVRRRQSSSGSAGALLPERFPARVVQLPDGAVRVLVAFGRNNNRGGLGQFGLGHLLELGPQGDLVFITWLIYAALLHARNLQGWKGERVAWLSIIGFGCVLFTYFGVNFLLSGLHSYARNNNCGGSKPCLVRLEWAAFAGHV